MDNAIWIAVGVLHLLAAVDICLSRLTRTAKILWVLVIVFLPAVGIAAWLLTRSSAHQTDEESVMTV
jgi:hypothetical protein